MNVVKEIISYVFKFCTSKVMSGVIDILKILIAIVLFIAPVYTYYFLFRKEIFSSQMIVFNILFLMILSVILFLLQYALVSSRWIDIHKEKWAPVEEADIVSNMNITEEDNILRVLMINAIVSGGLISIYILREWYFNAQGTDIWILIVLVGLTSSKYILRWVKILRYYIVLSIKR